MKKRKTKSGNGLTAVQISREDHAVLAEVKKRTLLPISAQLKMMISEWGERHLT